MKTSSYLRVINLVKSYAIPCSSLFYYLSFGNLYADSHPAAIIGGQGNAPYAAFIMPDGSIQNILGLPPTGLTFRVAINFSGYGLIGGTNGLNAYAALVSPKGILTPVPGLIAPGEIYTVSINKWGNGIVGGGHQISNIPFAALVSNVGKATPLIGLPASGLIYGVAIEKSGFGIVGGVGPLNSAYAALVSPYGTITPIAGLPTTGAIYWVAANKSGTKFIGGQSGSNNYAAFVAPNGFLSPVGGLQPGLLYSVAINNRGEGIVGGASANLPYAALVAPNGSSQTIAGLPTGTGIIYNVALNDSGTGLIGGFSSNIPFGAFVRPDGTLLPLKKLPSGPGFVDGLALHSAGVGIVGGVSANVPFTALVAPNGNLTYLTGLPNQGEINSIAISLLDNLVPKAIGPFDSFANTQFALSNTLTQHNLFRKFDCNCDCQTECGSSILWFAPFGNYVHQKSRGKIPSYSNNIWGALLGFDYNYCPEMVFGGALAYAQNKAHLFHDFGNADIHQESAVVYVTYETPCFYFNAALWGGIFQGSTKRKSFTIITSKASPRGWNLSPHFEVGMPFQTNACSIVEPFIAFDCANNWHTKYRERGSSGFNIVLKNNHSSLLRSELGLRLYQSFQYTWGNLLIEEKGSYVNRTPLKRNTRAYFIGSASTFDVETCSTISQNHGLAEIHLECTPICYGDFYTALDYQGEFGSSFQSQTFALTIGKSF